MQPNPDTQKAPARGLSDSANTEQKPQADGNASRTNPLSQPDFTDAQNFLDLIDPTASRFNFRTFNDGDAKDPGHKFHGSLASMATALENDNRNRRGVFVVINAGGDTDNSITSIRAVFADTDGAPLDPIMSCGFDPHVVVETSPGKYHAYWLVTGLAVDQFRGVQRQIARQFGTDRKVINPSRVMRLPGFDHHKGEAFRVRTIHESGAPAYTAEEVLEQFPPLAEFPDKAKDKPHKDRSAGAPLSSPGRVSPYADGALRRAAENVASAAEGSRNDTLNREAYSLAGIVDLSDSDIIGALEPAARAAGLSDSEIDATIVSGIASGRSRPREAPAPRERTHRAEQGNADSRGDEPRGSAWGEAHDPCTHLANAHRLVTHFGDSMLYVEGIGWHCWAPPWRHDESGARRFGHRLGRIIADEAAALAPWVAAAPDSDERKKREDAMLRRFKWASASESAPNIEHSLCMAQALLGCKAAQLDAKPELLGTPSGVLELTTGKHREHRQRDYITKLCGAEFDANATAPTWERVIAETFRDDESLIDYFQRLTGYMLSGHRGEHLLPIAWGGGANGKSTTLGTLQAMLGEYAGSAAPDLLISKPGSNHPTELADLHGKRLVIASETGEAGRLNEQRAKSVSGGDIIKARFMNRDFFEFIPTHLLVLQTNHRPKVQGTDEGIWRRLRLIPFAYTVPKEKRDPALPQKLLGELSGILAWAWRGWQRYQSQGFNDPPAIRAATADYRDASDAVGLFLTEFCEELPGLTVTAGDLYRAYTQWCEEAGEHAKSQRDFGMRLSERGFERVRYGGIHRWRGLTIRNDANGTGAPCAPCAPDIGLVPRESPSTREDPKSRGTSGTSGTYREQVRI